MAPTFGCPLAIDPRSLQRCTRIKILLTESTGAYSFWSLWKKQVTVMDWRYKGYGEIQWLRFSKVLAYSCFLWGKQTCIDPPPWTSTQMCVYKCTQDSANKHTRFPCGLIPFPSPKGCSRNRTINCVSSWKLWLGLSDPSSLVPSICWWKLLPCQVGSIFHT